MSLTHLVECKGDLSLVRVVDGSINVEICADGFHPAHGVGRFSREVGRESRFEFRDSSRHGHG